MHSNCSLGGFPEKTGKLESPDRQCLSIDPTSIGAYSNIILALRRLKRFDEMLETCEKAHQIKPDDVFIVHCRGDALWDLGRYEEALTAYDQALRLDPTYPYSYHNKSFILDHLGRKEEAREAHIQAAKYFNAQKSILNRLTSDLRVILFPIWVFGIPDFPLLCTGILGFFHLLGTGMEPGQALIYGVFGLLGVVLTIKFFSSVPPLGEYLPPRWLRPRGWYDLIVGMAYVGVGIVGIVYHPLYTHFPFLALTHIGVLDSIIDLVIGILSMGSSIVIFNSEVYVWFANQFVLNRQEIDQ